MLDVAPLGVSINETSVSVVLVENRGGNPYFLAARELALGSEHDKTITEKQIAALQQAKEEIAPGATTCVIAMPQDKVTVERFMVGPKEAERYVISSARLRADEVQTLADEDRFVAVDRLPASLDRMLSFGKIEDMTPLIEICKEAGLEVVGIDSPLAAWQRTMHDRPDGALIDLSTKRPALYIFGDPIGQVEQLAPALSPERLVAAIRKRFTEARMDRFSGVRRLTISGTLGEITTEFPYGDQMAAFIEGLKSDKGLEIEYLAFGKHENPGWAFASALAGWSFGGNGVLRANLMPPKIVGQIVFGMRVEPKDFLRAGITAAAVALLLGGLQFSINTQIESKGRDLDSVNSQLAAMATQTNNVGQLAADVQRLQEISRDATWLKTSGQTAALRLAYIGNAVPSGAWITHIRHGRDGWTIEGGAKDVKTLSIVARGFQNVSPGLQTAFSEIDTKNIPTYKVGITEPPAPRQPIIQQTPAATSTPSPGTTK